MALSHVVRKTSRKSWPMRDADRRQVVGSGAREVGMCEAVMLQIEMR